MRSMLIYFLVLSMALPACQSVPTRTVEATPAPIDCGSESLRQPASLYCQDVFKDRAEVAVARDREEVRERLLQVDYKEISTAEMARLWQPLSLQRQFSRKHDDAFWASLIGHERLMAAKMSDTPAVLVFGEQTSFNWLAAVRRLDRVPKGQFKLDQNIVSLVNRDIHTAQAQQLAFTEGRASSKEFRYDSDAQAALNKILPLVGGRFRERSLYDMNNIFRSMSEKEYQAFREAQSISGVEFWQMPWSRTGKRFGIFRYPAANQSAQKVEVLFNETNARMAAIRDGRSKEDPIALAAEFQWRFVQLHPMVNGNGRTSRALMNRILAEFDLPPSSRRQIDMDFTVSLPEHIQLVREGVYESIRFAANEKFDGRVTAYKRGFGNRLTTAEIAELTKSVVTERKLTSTKELFPETPDQIFEMGGHKFTLGDDMMFYDRFGVPHTVRYAHGFAELSPIADKSYILYSLSGKRNGVKHLQRDLSDAATEAVRYNSELIMKIAKDPKAAEAVRVTRYENVEHANNQEQFQFYNWQVPLLKEVTRIKEDPLTEPLAVLVQNRGHKSDRSYLGRSYVEKAFFAEKATLEPSEVIGHYLRADQFYYELRRYLESPREDFLRAPELQQSLLRDLDASREKLHAAGRTILKPFIQEIAGLQKADRDYLMNHPQFRLTYEYFLRTPLAFSTLKEAGRRLDPNKTVVLRSAVGSKVERLGFLSDRQMKDFILGIPFLGSRFEGFLRNVHGEIQRLRDGGQPVDVKAPFFARQVANYAVNNPTMRNAISGLLEYIMVHPNAHRSLDPEMARGFVTQYLHTQLDLGPKETLSTTANPTYLLTPRKDNSGQFEAKFAWQDATIYILEVPRSSLRVDNSSGYTVQMEIGMKPMSGSETRKATVFKLAANENSIFTLPEAPMTERAGRVMELMREVSTLMPQPEAAPAKAAGE